MEDYYGNITQETQEYMGNLEAKARHKRIVTSDAIVDVEFKPFIPDTRSTRARDTKYLYTIDLYWHMKIMLYKAITVEDVAQTKMARQVEFIQLQNQLTNEKLGIMASKQGITFNNDGEDISQVPRDPPSSCT